MSIDFTGSIDFTKLPLADLLKIESLELKSIPKDTSSVSQVVFNVNVTSDTSTTDMIEKKVQRLFGVKGNEKLVVERIARNEFKVSIDKRAYKIACEKMLIPRKEEEAKEVADSEDETKTRADAAKDGAKTEPIKARETDINIRVEQPEKEELEDFLTESSISADKIKNTLQLVINETLEKKANTKKIKDIWVVRFDTLNYYITTITEVEPGKFMIVTKQTSLKDVREKFTNEKKGLVKLTREE